MDTSAEIFNNASLTQIVHRVVPGMPHELLLVCLDGHEIPEVNWRLVRPLPGSVVTVHNRLQGGDGNLLGTIAAIAITAAGIFISAGALVPFLGAAFASGTFGAQAASLLVTVGGQLAIGALFPPAKQDARASRADEDYAGASAGSNTLEPGGSLPYITFEREVAPPMIMRPRQFLKDGFDYVHAVFALASPHAASDPRIGGASIDGADDVRVAIHEGFDETFNGCRIVRRGGVPVSLKQPISRFKTNEQSSVLNDQINWQKSSPQWHRFVSTAGAVEIRIRVQIGFFGKTDDGSMTARCPLRLRIRARGETAWRNLPEVHLVGHQTTPIPREIVFTFDSYPEFVPPVGDYSTFKSAFRHVPHTSQTEPSPQEGTYQWECDSAFSTGTGIGDYGNVQFTRDNVTFHLDDTFDQADAYEIEVMQGNTVNNASFNTSTYQNGGVIYPLFGPYRNSNNLLQTVHDPEVYVTDLSAVFLDSVFDIEPVAYSGDAYFEVEGRGRSIDQFTVKASAYVPVFEDGQWLEFSRANATTSPYPADHYYNLLSNERLSIDSLSSQSIDVDGLADWRAECVARDFRCNAIIESSVSGAMDILAQNGFARKKISTKFGIVYERDRSSEGPVQVFSPRNARNLRTSRPLVRRPRGFVVRFYDSEQNDRRREIVIDNPYGPDIGGYETMSYPGLVTEAAVRRRALFDFEQIERRSNKYMLDVGAESIGSEADQKVGLCWDVLVETHRYSLVTDINGTNDVLTLETAMDFTDLDGVFAQDEFFAVPSLFTLGKQTAISIVTPTGVETIAVDSVSEFEATLSTPLSSSDVLGQPVAIGLSESVYRDMILVDVDRKDDHKATLTMVDAAPEVAAVLAT